MPHATHLGGLRTKQPRYITHSSCSASKVAGTCRPPGNRVILPRGSQPHLLVWTNAVIDHLRVINEKGLLSKSHKTPPPIVQPARGDRPIRKPRKPDCARSARGDRMTQRETHLMAHRPLVEVVGHRKRSANGTGQRYTVFVDEKAITSNHLYLSVGFQKFGLSP